MAKNGANVPIVTQEMRRQQIKHALKALVYGVMQKHICVTYPILMQQKAL
jgi:hypothetical protein